MKDEEKFLLTGLGLGPEKAEADFFFGPGLGLVGLATPLMIPNWFRVLPKGNGT